MNEREKEKGRCNGKRENERKEGLCVVCVCVCDLLVVLYKK